MENQGVLATIGAMPPSAQAFCSLLIACYLFPAAVAFAGDHRSRWAILLVNVVLGWSVIFWFVALVFAFAAPRSSAQPTGSSTQSTASQPSTPAQGVLETH